MSEVERLQREADAATSEAAVGRGIAEKLVAIAIEKQWRVGDDGDRLIGPLCREAFIRRLAELLEVEL